MIEEWASLSWGEMPTREQWDEHVPEGPFPMTLRGADYEAAARIINQGIDSHLEAVHAEADGADVVILDRDSLWTFVRRCSESPDDETADLVGSIAYVLGIEWI